MREEGGKSNCLMATGSFLRVMEYFGTGQRLWLYGANVYYVNFISVDKKKKNLDARTIKPVHSLNSPIVSGYFLLT